MPSGHDESGAPGASSKLRETSYPWMLKPRGLGWIRIVGWSRELGHTGKEFSPNAGRDGGQQGLRMAVTPRIRSVRRIL